MERFRRHDGIDAAHLVAYLPTDLEQVVRIENMSIHLLLLDRGFPSGGFLLHGRGLHFADGGLLDIQGGALLAWMTVAENVALPLEECTKLSDLEIAVRVRHALRAVELTATADKYPAEISGGMQKRAGLARAVVRESDIVLYDEPTSGLDPVTSITINRRIRKLNRELGITSIVVTHDMQGALDIADRILLLKGGRVVECSAPAEFTQSTNPDVREFLAAMKGETI